MSTVAEFDHIWPFDSVTLGHAPCVRCGATYGPDAGMCRVEVEGEPRIIEQATLRGVSIDEGGWGRAEIDIP